MSNREVRRDVEARTVSRGEECGGLGRTLDEVRTADAYVLMEVIHDRPDAEAASILDAIGRAASPGARVLIVENVLDDAQPDPRGYSLDVIMLAVTGGRERTGRQLGGLLEGAGFANSTATATSGPMRIVEAMAP
ncbi:MAG: methyltransferase [Ilumatobacteraceae bacterium]